MSTIYSNLCKMTIDMQLHREHNKKIGFVNGTFDIIKPGHIDLFLYAKSLCDILIVGVNNESFLKRNNIKTLYNSSDRTHIINNMKSVDYVLIGPSSGCNEWNNEILELCPDILVKGINYTIDNIEGGEKEACERIGCKLYIMNKNGNFSIYFENIKHIVPKVNWR